MKWLERDIKLGTIVAYLIDANDHDLNNKKPFARANAKLFYNEDDYNFIF